MLRDLKERRTNDTETVGIVHHAMPNVLDVEGRIEMNVNEQYRGGHVLTITLKTCPPQKERKMPTIEKSIEVNVPVRTA